jgi:BlaI family transcriptional regulator, penicillinase repressor
MREPGPPAPAIFVPLGPVIAFGTCSPHTAAVPLPTDVVDSPMTLPKLSQLELKIMEALWSHGPCSVREVQESFPESDRPAFTTIQTMIYRLEGKKAVRRAKKIGNALIFEAIISRNAARRRLVDDLLAAFGGRIQPLMSHLIEAGQLTLEDVEEARKMLRKPTKKE